MFDSKKNSPGRRNNACSFEEPSIGLSRQIENFRLLNVFRTISNLMQQTKKDISNKFPSAKRDLATEVSKKRKKFITTEKHSFQQREKSKVLPVSDLFGPTKTLMQVSKNLFFLK